MERTDGLCAASGQPVVAIGDEQRLSERMRIWSSRDDADVGHFPISINAYKYALRPAPAVSGETAARARCPLFDNESR